MYKIAILSGVALFTLVMGVATQVSATVRDTGRPLTAAELVRRDLNPLYDYQTRGAYGFSVGAGSKPSQPIRLHGEWPLQRTLDASQLQGVSNE